MSAIWGPPLQELGYCPKDLIGHGQFASAWLVEANGFEFVAKVIALDHLSAEDYRLAKQEVQVLQRLRHPNIVWYYTSAEVQAVTTASDVPPQKALVIVTEYCPGGDLRTLIRARRGDGAEPADPIPEAQILLWATQLLVAIREIHGNRILHRDIKASNLFLSEDQRTLKIGDFGVSRVLDCSAGKATSVVGTPYCMSPEVCRSEPYREKSDLWAVGCVLYELCTYRHPFESTSLLGLVHRIVFESTEALPDIYSARLRSMVDSLLSKRAEDRPSVDDLLADELLRPYLISVDFQVRHPSAKHLGSIAEVSTSGEVENSEVSSDASMEEADGAPDNEVEESVQQALEKFRRWASTKMASAEQDDDSQCSEGVSVYSDGETSDEHEV